MRTVNAQEYGRYAKRIQDMSDKLHAGPQDLRRGDPVTVSWRGELRHGVVTGDTHGDTLPTGARFVPVFFDDDETEHNVDTRVVMLGLH